MCRRFNRRYLEIRFRPGSGLFLHPPSVSGLFADMADEVIPIAIVELSLPINRDAYPYFCHTRI
jgi:hypothetical protein